MLKKAVRSVFTLDIMNYYVSLAYISLKIAIEWMNLEGSMLSEIKQSEKYCMIPLMWGSQIQRDGK